ncbi:hypothetical protein [Corynebacterium freneyi]|uniref:Uncharacterized protein n=2 Tax=Corynebacterium freneyi TaxID=134034 RepID=A0A095Y5R9_9CORY|nr:hypothetical protein [Corynebacterium freneyi]KGF17361.1 hypothetical protein HMPREF1650_04135 [Corynebacterium freneyi DNF00450]MBP2333289.1 hypothetical protein [Corynebacterium freneyi]QXA52659.1 hypothetical protein I6L56_11535 [Corynebacterium freneyi]WJZ04607.1 hypothetical protein CFREN_03105 [Corynebacterium freneyi]
MEKALAFDLMERGRSIHDLGSIRMSWVELGAFIAHAPPDSAIRMLRDPLSAFRTAESTLLSTVVDTLAGANWQRGGGKGARPQPLMKRIQQELDRQKQDASAPASVAQMTSIREELAARRRKSVAATGMTRAVKNTKP